MQGPTTRAGAPEETNAEPSSKVAKHFHTEIGEDLFCDGGDEERIGGWAANHTGMTRRTADGLPVHSFQTLLKDLPTLTKNRLRAGGKVAFDQLASPRPSSSGPSTS